MLGSNFVSTKLMTYGKSISPHGIVAPKSHTFQTDYKPLLLFGEIFKKSAWCHFINQRLVYRRHLQRCMCGMHVPHSCASSVVEWSGRIFSLITSFGQEDFALKFPKLLCHCFRFTLTYFRLRPEYRVLPCKDTWGKLDYACIVWSIEVYYWLNKNPFG